MAETADPLPAPTYISTAANEDDDDEEEEEEEEEEEVEEEEGKDDLRLGLLLKPQLERIRV